MKDYSFYLITVVFVSLISICGIAPLFVGIIKKQKAIGQIGFIACILIGFFYGFIAAFPLSLIFMTVIFLRKKKDNTDNFTAR